MTIVPFIWEKHEWLSNHCCWCGKSLVDWKSRAFKTGTEQLTLEMSDGRHIQVMCHESCVPESLKEDLKP